jgi:uncharacterized protein (TIGR02594 family)
LRIKFILIALFISGCSEPVTTQAHETHPNLNTAWKYYDYSEVTHRNQLKQFTGIDPVRTEWCAAFVNAVLEESGIEGSSSVSEYPLTARSFLRWGIGVKYPEAGDIVVFPRGNSSWQGHVGFYMQTVYIGGIEHYAILGGNQNDKVSIDFYPSSKAIAIRRYIF